MRTQQIKRTQANTHASTRTSRVFCDAIALVLAIALGGSGPFRDAGCIGLAAGTLHIYASSGKKTRGLKVI